jgi:two-component system OmpR family sensor kinase
MAEGDARTKLAFAVDAKGRDLLGRPVRCKRFARGASHRRRKSARGPQARRGGAAPVLSRRSRRAAPAAAAAAPPPPWEIAIIVGIASFAVSGLLAWYLARPIRALRWAFGAAAEGRLETRARPLMQGRRDEIADLGDDFDRMAEQLQGLVAAQRRLLHDVSHELRSPLARLQAAIGLARQNPARPRAFARPRAW